MVTIGCNVFLEEQLDVVIDTIIEEGTVQDCKCLIMYFMEEDPRTTVSHLAAVDIGIHPCAFSPSNFKGRWYQALHELIAEERLQWFKKGRGSYITLAR